MGCICLCTCCVLVCVDWWLDLPIASEPNGWTNSNLPRNPAELCAHIRIGSWIFRTPSCFGAQNCVGSVPQVRRIGPAPPARKLPLKICFYQPSGTSQREFSRIPKIVKRVIKSERRNINHLIFRLKPNRILIFESIIEAKKITNFIIWFPFRR